MIELIVKYNIPVVKVYKFGDLSIVKKTVNSWTNQEGVMLVMKSGEKYKIKGEDYVLKHKTKDKVAKHRHVWEAAIAGNIDDIYPLLSEKDREEAQKVEKHFWEVRNKAIEHYETIAVELKEKSMDKKNYALNFIQKEALVNQCVFALFDGRSVESVIDNHVLKNISKDSLFDLLVEHFDNL